MSAEGRGIGGRRPPLQNEDLEREIPSTDTAIEGLVHEPYGITDEHRRIIESKD
jgi:hypothetical protein